MRPGQYYSISSDMVHIENTDKLLKMAMAFEMFALGAKVHPDFKRPIDENKAMDIYDKYLKPTRHAIDFFSKLEKQNKPSKKLDAAFLAAGGDSSDVIEGRVSRPSSPLYSKVSPHWELLMGPQRLNVNAHDGDVIEGMLSLSRDRKTWDLYFAKEAINLKARVDAALTAYKTTK
jgi:hypothetical protein